VSLPASVSAATTRTSATLVVQFAAAAQARAAATADPVSRVSAAAGEAPDESGVASASKPYGGHTDEELTALAAHWDGLDKVQRRALLTEMKLRMARSGRSGNRVIHIRTERRYGRIIREPGGRLIRIETQVVQVRPMSEDAARQAFGVGFEQRLGRRDGTTEVTVTAGSASAQDGSVPTEGGPTDGPMAESGAGRRLEPATPPMVEPKLPLYRVSDPAP
jgi:hypothetical protein